MKLAWIQLKLARAQMGIFILVAILQRAPVIKHAIQFEKALAAPVAKLIKTTTYVATGMGLFHATAGATTFVVNPSSPADATVGEEFAMAFDLTGSAGVTVSPSSWRITGDIPPGLTVPGLSGNNVNTEDPVAIQGTPTQAGTFEFTVQAWRRVNQTGDSGDPVTLTIVVAPPPPPPAPEIVNSPSSTRAPTSGRVQFFFESSGIVDAIQWRKDDVELPGETGPTLIISDVSVADEGAYTVEVSNGGGSAVSSAGTLTIDDEASTELVNLSNRGFVGEGADIMIPGLVVVGGVSKTVLVRGLGPALAASNVPGFLEDPELRIFQLVGAGAQLLLSNDDWEDQVGLEELQQVLTDLGKPMDAGSKDAAMLVSLNQGVYTFQLAGVGGTTGVALMELFVID